MLKNSSSFQSSLFIMSSLTMLSLLILSLSIPSICLAGGGDLDNNLGADENKLVEQDRAVILRASEIKAILAITYLQKIIGPAQMTDSQRIEDYKQKLKNIDNAHFETFRTASFHIVDKIQKLPTTSDKIFWLKAISYLAHALRNSAQSYSNGILVTHLWNMVVDQNSDMALRRQAALSLSELATVLPEGSLAQVTERIESFNRDLRSKTLQAEGSDEKKYQNLSEAVNILEILTMPREKIAEKIHNIGNRSHAIAGGIRLTAVLNGQKIHQALTFLGESMKIYGEEMTDYTHIPVVNIINNTTLWPGNTYALDLGRKLRDMNDISRTMRERSWHR